MRFAISAWIVAAAVIGAASAALAAPPRFSQAVDTTAPGSPIHITWTSVYSNSQEHLYCVSFSAVSTTISNVTFEISEVGRIQDKQTFTRTGSFAPGVEIRSPHGEALSSYELNHLSATCSAFTSALSDVYLSTIRVTGTTAADGTTWTAPPPKTAPAPTFTPDPPDLAPAPPWDAAHHAGYLAVVTGSATKSHPDAKPYIAIFAPGHGAPSAVIHPPDPDSQYFGIAFDGAGNLYISTQHKGVFRVAPAASPTLNPITAQPGYALAASADGGIAVGGLGVNDHVEVVPASGPSYRIDAEPIPNGLIAGPGGEFSLVDGIHDEVRTYPAGSKQPSRVLKLAPGPRSAVTVASLSYDAAGDLAVLDATANEIRLYAPGSSTPMWHTPISAASSIAFGAAGELNALRVLGVLRYHPGSSENPEFLVEPFGMLVAASPDGRRFVINNLHDRVDVFAADGTKSVIPQLAGMSHLAVSL